MDGYVRNLPDGHVDLVAEGAPADLDAFLQGVQEAMLGNVRDAKVQTSPASGEFDGFSVRY